MYRSPWTYGGHVRIDLDIVSATRSILLHVQGLVVSTAQVVVTFKDEESVFIATDIIYDSLHQRCILNFEEAFPLAPKYNVVLHVSFQGVVNYQLTGFYRSSYDVPPGESTGGEIRGETEASQFMLSTQFQPTYARRAFPCFDEPALKATFDFSVEVPLGVTALSNMAIKRERPGLKEGFRVVEFERTPLMSTYLLAWAIGDFEYIEHIATRADVSSYPIRVYTTRGLAKHGKFGLEVAIKSLDLLTKVGVFCTKCASVRLLLTRCLV